MLDPMILPDLRVIFVGSEPGKESLRTGHYFADSRNSFYRDLYQSGWTRKIYSSQEDANLLANENIGMYDVYDSPKQLELLLAEYKPRIVCFNSKMALERFIQYELGAGQWAGENAGKHVNFHWGPIVWALYDSSGQAAGYRVKRIELLKDLIVK